jgi:hypothetical protein
MLILPKKDRAMRNLSSVEANEHSIVAKLDGVTPHLQFGVETAAIAQRKSVGVHRTNHRLGLLRQIGSNHSFCKRASAVRAGVVQGKCPAVAHPEYGYRFPFHLKASAPAGRNQLY